VHSQQALSCKYFPTLLWWLQDVSTAMSACGKLGCRAMGFFKAAAAAANEWLPRTTARDLAEVIRQWITLL
jgi:hypothetical protein